jgi:hypothetical protein
MANLTETEVALEKSAAHHVEDTLGHGAIVEAKHAADEEHAQTLWQALRDNRKAVFWSALISMVSFIEASFLHKALLTYALHLQSIVMEGYDIILMGNFFGYPTFQKKYGVYYGEELGYQIPARWQTGLNMSSTVGCIFYTHLSLSTGR